MFLSIFDILKNMDRNEVLNTLARLLEENTQKIIDINQQDFSAYLGDDQAMLDRLKVDEKKVLGMVDSVRTVLKMENPDGKVLNSYQHKNGMIVENKTVPFGKILIIYESRPDVTIEASSIAFKAGNKVVLKGGREAGKTNLFLVDLWQEALQKNGMEKDFVKYVDYGRDETQNLIKNNTLNVDLIIPRGGEGLINFVLQNTNVPVIVSGRGNNFLYLDKEVDFEMGKNIILNGKSRISVCNALDKVLINKDLPNLESSIAILVDSLIEKNITVLGDENLAKLNKKIIEIKGEEIFGQEFLAAKIYLSLVNDMDEAILKINKYSGKHSTCIVTGNKDTAKKFQDEADCAAVHHNTSVRFTDGGQFGFGAEIGISTQKLHSRGPIGVAQLVTNKWYINGNGQIRE